MTELTTAAREAAEGTSIRPFKINIPEAQLVDLRRQRNGPKSIPDPYFLEYDSRYEDPDPKS